VQTVQQVHMDISYEPFSREPEYVQLNGLFLRSLGLEENQRVLELACGTGTLTQLLLEQQPDLWIVGLDISQEALTLARRHLAEHGFTVSLLEASADSLPIAGCSMDTVVMGNSIQLVEDKHKLFHEISRVLRQGGIFAFNTSFYAGTYVPGTERFYVQWVAQASNFIKRKSEELAAHGLPRVTRQKGLAERAFSRPWLSVQEYTDLLQRNGFAIRSMVERTVMLTQRSFEAIGAYAGLARVLLSGYPVALACEALAKASGPALAAVNMEVVPRYWLEMVAVKR
jgi:ubiquinone/menaquinone biosynthesis C-methylase UbiE